MKKSYYMATQRAIEIPPHPPLIKGGIVIILLVAFLGGCAATRVERVKPEEAIDLS